MRGLGVMAAMFVVAGAAGLAGMLVLQLLVYAPQTSALTLEPGHQEIVWIAPATSTEAWERLVEAMKRLCKDSRESADGGPILRITTTDAFLEHTAAVPQVALHFDGSEQAKLWIRWYKLSSSMGQEDWVKKLRARSQPPLAIIGGDTSDRALTLSRILEEARTQWRGSAPLLLITTATADRYYPQDIHFVDLTEEKWPKLMDVYKGQTFRFCFTNSHMAHAVLDFLQENPQVWESCNSQPQVLAGSAAVGSALGTLGMLAAAGHMQGHFLYTFAWSDDRYSVDLGDRFLKVFVDDFHGGDSASANRHRMQNYIPHGVGDAFQANAREEHAVGAFLADSLQFRDQHQLLIVPASAQRARRFLRALCRRAPLDVRNIVVGTGDSISFNSVFRDRDVAWNILDLPVPLVFFTHRNPVDESAGFGRRMKSTGRINTTSTQDLLLYRDIIEALVQSAQEPEGWLGDSERVRERLLQTRWFKGRIRNPQIYPEAAKGLLLFDDEGNRRGRTGEHVVWLRPKFKDGRVTPLADISVWHVDAGVSRSTTWKRAGRLVDVLYNCDQVPGSPIHVGN